MIEIQSRGECYPDLVMLADRLAEVEALLARAEPAFRRLVERVEDLERRAAMA